MAIKGSLREASLPDVLQLLALGQKSGCLSVADRSSFGYIYFDRGNVSYASIVNRRDRLGDLLVKNGLVEPEVLAAAVESQGSRTAQRLGEILIEREAITREQLERYIRLQIEEAVYFLFTWTQGSFRFDADQRPEPGAMLVSINPESLLLEGARRVDEWSLMEKKIPSFDLIFALDPAARDVSPEELTADQRRILPLVDGRRSLREVVEDAGMVEFDVGKALFGLIQAGLAHPRGRKPAREQPGVAPGRVQEHRNLGVAFYRTRMFEEAVREFRHVMELQPGDLDAAFHLGLIGLRTGHARFAARRFMEVIERGGRWSSAFHDLALTLESQGRPGEALLALEEGVRLRPDDPRLHLSRAVLLLKDERVAEAADSFDRYRARLGPEQTAPAAYYAFAPLALGACGRLPEARAVAEEGVDRHPHVPAVLLHAGAVLERSGSWEEAEMLYRRAVDEGPEVPQAHKALGDVLYRRGSHAEAAESYERAIAIAPDLGADLPFKLGNLRYKAGDRAAAVELWRDALRLDPGHEIARTNLELVARAEAGR